jgi:hypothetical protein
MGKIAQEKNKRGMISIVITDFFIRTENVGGKRVNQGGL